MNQASVKKGINAIAKVDADVAKALKTLAYPAPRVRPAGFETFFNDHCQPTNFD